MRAGAEGCEPGEIVRLVDAADPPGKAAPQSLTLSSQAGRSLDSMRRSLALLTAAAASAVMAASATSASQPRLALVDDEPLVVRGAAFAPGERVTVTALTLLGPKRVVTKAGAGGAFRASLALVGQPCGRRSRFSPGAPEGAARRCGWRSSLASRLRSTEQARRLRTGSGGVAPARSASRVVVAAYFEDRPRPRWWRSAGRPLLIEMVVPVFGTFTLFHPGWCRPGCGVAWPFSSRTSSPSCRRRCPRPSARGSWSACC